MHRLALVVGFVLLVSACDTPPGIPPPAGEPPRLSNLTISPTDVDLSDLDGNAISNGRARFEVDIRADVRSEGGGIDEVRYTVRRPDRLNAGIVTSGEMTLQNGAYRASPTIDLAAGEVGNYQVVVTARSAGGLVSNELAAMLRYRADGSAPYIVEVVATPNPLSPPGVLTIVVTADDPDGIENIARVLGLTPAGAQFELFDDGESFGDEVAGDGRFTARFNVDSATPGTQTFRFWAIDRLGLESEVVQYDVVIE